MSGDVNGSGTCSRTGSRRSASSSTRSPGRRRGCRLRPGGGPAAAARTTHVDPLTRLTARERDVLEHMAQGYTNARHRRGACTSRRAPSRSMSTPSSTSSELPAPPVTAGGSWPCCATSAPDDRIGVKLPPRRGFDGFVACRCDQRACSGVALRPGVGRTVRGAGLSDSGGPGRSGGAALGWVDHPRGTRSRTSLGRSRRGAGRGCGPASRATSTAGWSGSGTGSLRRPTHRPHADLERVRPSMRCPGPWYRPGS